MVGSSCTLPPRQPSPIGLQQCCRVISQAVFPVEFQSWVGRQRPGAQKHLCCHRGYGLDGQPTTPCSTIESRTAQLGSVIRGKDSTWWIAGLRGKNPPREDMPSAPPPLIGYSAFTSIAALSGTAIVVGTWVVYMTHNPQALGFRPLLIMAVAECETAALDSLIHLCHLSPHWRHLNGTRGPFPPRGVLVIFWSAFGCGTAFAFVPPPHIPTIPSLIQPPEFPLLGKIPW